MQIQNGLAKLQKLKRYFEIYYSCAQFLQNPVLYELFEPPETSVLGFVYSDLKLNISKVRKIG